jgi:membrane protease YdiL (CAAX protease family)
MGFADGIAFGVLIGTVLHEFVLRGWLMPKLIRNERE